MRRWTSLKGTRCRRTRLEAGQPLGDGPGLLPAGPREEGEGVEVDQDHLRPPAHEAVGGHGGVYAPREEGHHLAGNPGRKPPGPRVAGHLQKGRPGQDADHELPFRPLEAHLGPGPLLDEGPQAPLQLRGGEREGLVGALGRHPEGGEAFAFQSLRQSGLYGLKVWGEAQHLGEGFHAQGAGEARCRLGPGPLGEAEEEGHGPLGLQPGLQSLQGPLDVGLSLLQEEGPVFPFEGQLVEEVHQEVFHLSTPPSPPGRGGCTRSPSWPPP